MIESKVLHGMKKVVFKRLVDGAVVTLLICGYVQAAQAANVATVNGQNLTDSDLDFALRDLNEFQRADALKNPITKEDIIHQLIDTEVTAQEARRRGLDKTPEFKATMEGFERRILADLLIEKELGTQMSPAAIKSFYESNKWRYTTAQVQLQHVLLETREKAEEVLQLARKSGVQFSDLAVRFSKDPAAKTNQGDMGLFTRDKINPEMAEAVFKAKKGDIVGPVRTSYGFHVIRLVSRLPGRQLDYGDVEFQVRNDFRNQLVRSYVNRLRSKAKVSIGK